MKRSATDTILVTGGAGFIGSCLCRQLIQETDRHVVTLDKLTYAGNLDSLAPVADHDRFTFVQGDIGDADLVAELLEEYRPQAIMNLAAESHVDRSIDGPLEFVRTNVLGTASLLDQSLKYWRTLASESAEEFRFLHISTDEVFGSLGATGYFTEETPYAPNSPYSASKASSDHMVRAWHHTFGLPTLTTNCSNNYGPYQFPEKLIPLMILNALEGRRLPVYGDGKNVRDWLHVEDHCRALRTVLDLGKPGETYSIGGNCERQNIEIVKTICRVLDELAPSETGQGRECLIEYVPDRLGHDRRYAIDASKIERELGWAPEHNFETGLTETIKWYLENSEWVHRVQSGKYQRQRLGVQWAD